MRNIIKQLIGIFYPKVKVIPPGETELDYLPKPKTKAVRKNKVKNKNNDKF